MIFTYLSKSLYISADFYDIFLTLSDVFSTYLLCIFSHSLDGLLFQPSDSPKS